MATRHAAPTRTISSGRRNRSRREEWAWKAVRQELHPKERYYLPFAEQQGVLNISPQKGARRWQRRRRGNTPVSESSAPKTLPPWKSASSRASRLHERRILGSRGSLETRVLFPIHAEQMIVESLGLVVAASAQTHVDGAHEREVVALDEIGDAGPGFKADQRLLGLHHDLPPVEDAYRETCSPGTDQAADLAQETLHRYIDHLAADRLRADAEAAGRRQHERSVPGGRQRGKDPQNAARYAPEACIGRVLRIEVGHLLAQQQGVQARAELPGPLQVRRAPVGRDKALRSLRHLHQPGAQAGNDLLGGERAERQQALRAIGSRRSRQRLPACPPLRAHVLIQIQALPGPEQRTEGRRQLRARVRRFQDFRVGGGVLQGESRAGAQQGVGAQARENIVRRIAIR